MKVEYQIIKAKNDCFTTVEKFEKLLQTAESFETNTKDKIIEFKNKKIKYNIKKYDSKHSKEIIYNILLELKEDENAENIKFFEEFDSKFLRIIGSYSSEQNKMYINTLTDEISMYYSKELYPQFNEIENMLRKIIYIFMENSFGSSWVKKTLPEDLKKSLDVSFERRNITNVENDYLDNIDFIQLGAFLFEEYPNYNQQEMIKLLEKIKDFKPENLKQEIPKIIEEGKKKSNYSRYFNDNLENDNLQEKWAELYKYRCVIAHNKKIREKEYSKSIELIDELKAVFLKCIKGIDTAEVPEEEKENLEKFGKDVFSLNYNLGSYTNSAISSLRDYRINNAWASYEKAYAPIRKFNAIDSAIISATETINNAIPGRDAFSGLNRELLLNNRIESDNRLLIGETGSFKVDDDGKIINPNDTKNNK